ncbi:hypothetical protein [Bacillus toyonensis]|uniref:HNH domain-containing protein n=1 Tax=Bacillus toyonensis TaxID=155322 RepID=A0A2B7VZF3_9BACI|nr:hypothetical protein [Bacillus toyonensis]PEK78526.1 hypothetical protein CN594_26335 [Bacillus toyonensis]PEL17661.1 hypothetical protein CN624_29560 [Bacillus toyonensis]PFY44479.1 hypothetical protein COL55_19700 [Bacillus toyonensis]PFY48336.1 hypothetical protein COL54_06155 [Bacillus toyonensis]PFY61936.1 hypothetical protein COL62_32165 [Bacillus toyonensis]
MNKEIFAQWLKTDSNLKPYSIGRYANAIDTLTSELDSYGLPEVNLFDISDTAFIDTILNNQEFQKKNDKGNRMYSTALKHFKRYMEFYYKEYRIELLKEEMDYEKSIVRNIVKENVKVKIVDKEQEKPAYRTVNTKKIWSRNPRYASEVVADANNLCEFDNEHRHFISKFNQKNYVEAHHLIPMKYQDHFDCSLDVHANIVSICLVCHKKIHFGLFEDKKEILDKLFDSRRERLKASGIEVVIDEFYSYYQK